MEENEKAGGPNKFRDAINMRKKGVNTLERKIPESIQNAGPEEMAKLIQADVEATAQSLILNSLAASTLRSYGASFQSWIQYAVGRAAANPKFASIYDAKSHIMIPHSPDGHFETKMALTSFFAYSWKYALRNHSWMRTTLSAIRKAHSAHDQALTDFHTSGATALISAVEKMAPPPKLKNPVLLSTVVNWVNYHVHLHPDPNTSTNGVRGDNYRNMRIAILCTLGWFALLRISELVDGGKNKGNEKKELLAEDIWPVKDEALMESNDPESWEKADAFKMTIRSSKTDQVGEGFSRVFRRSRALDGDATVICPVRLLKKFVGMDPQAWTEAISEKKSLGEVHSLGEGRKAGWRPLKKSQVSSFIIDEGKKAKGQPEVTAHSLRAGGACALIASGVVSHASIMLLGRWKSGAFLRYIAKATSSSTKNTPEESMMTGEITLI